MVIDHIGYLCADIRKSISSFETLGYRPCSKIFRDDVVNSETARGYARNVDICFLENEAYRIELVSPIDETSDVYQTLKRQGEGPYHICYRTDDLEQEIQTLKMDGYMLMKRPAMAIAFGEAKVAFLFKRAVGMIELVETRE